MITGLNLALPNWADLGRAGATLLLKPWRALQRRSRRKQAVRDVLELNDYLLRDLGLNRDWLHREALKSSRRG